MLPHYQWFFCHEKQKFTYGQYPIKMIVTSTDTSYKTKHPEKEKKLT